jgi:hypothetical protein
MKKLLEGFKDAISWSDILRAKQDKNLIRLNEASLGRAYQHFLKGPKESFAIVTAWRVAESTDGLVPRVSRTNKSNMQDLANDIRDAKLGFFKMRGNWIECFATDEIGHPVSYKDCPDDKKKITSEPSYFVIGASKEQLTKWISDYDQDAGLYHGPDTSGHTILLYRNGQEEDLGPGFHPNKAAQGFSKIRGKTFVFEYIQQGESFVEALVFQKYSNYKL